MFSRPLLLLVALCAGLPAQEFPYWNTVPLPGPLSTPANNAGFKVVAFGTNCAVQTATDVHLYSGILRTWTQIPVSPAATPYLRFNDHVVVRDGNLVHGWSTRTGVVDTIVVSPTATVATGVDGGSWTASVVDGNVVYGYAAFAGGWSSLTTASATPTVQHSNHLFVVQDGAAVYGFSAYFGTFEPAPLSTVRVVQQSLAVCTTASDDVWTFSSYDNLWSSTHFPGASSATTHHWATYALLVAGTNVLGCSGDGVKFAVHTGANAPTNVKIAPECAIFMDGPTVVGFAPAVAAFATMVPVNTPSPTLFPAENRFGCYAVVLDGPDLYAFSGVFGTFVGPVTGPFAMTYSDATAFAASTVGGTSYVYSGVKHAFYATTATFTASQILYNGLVLTTPTGYVGFSSRLGTFSVLNAPTGVPAIHGSLFSVLNGASASVYDSVLGRWETFSGTGPLTASTWRLTQILHDGSTAYGFSLFTNVVDSTPILGTIAEFRANSEIAYVLTDTHLHVFTSFGTLSPLFRFPEHARHQPRGSDLRLFQTATPGSFVDAFVSDLPLYQPLAPFGTVLIDYASPAFFSFPVGIVPASGILENAYPVPTIPGFVGLQLRIQNVVQPPAGIPWITSAVAPVFL